MPVHKILRGQKITRQKLDQAERLRKTLTLAEYTLWQRLRGNQINGLHFRRQQIIDGFIVDFYCHAASLVIELDGGIHLQQKAHDTARQIILESKGLRFLRFSNEQVLCDLDSVLERIRNVCAECTRS